jgi:DNA polymerase
MPAKQRVSRLASLPSLSKRPTVQPESGPSAIAEEFPIVEEIMQHVSSPVVEEVSAASTDTIESIRAEIGDCTRCPLHAQGKTQIVHTTGNFQADLMFVGEAPGADEDEQGLPFVGRAGRLLTDIIKAMGFERENVCIGNINRCRPPGNRKPEPEETAACRPFLIREIAVVKPKVIVVLGATAAHNLLQVKTPITKMRGEFHDYFGVKVMPTFHPAYLLRDPHKKKDVWEDMKKVRDYLTGSAK